MTTLQTRPLTLPSHYKGPDVERDDRLEHPTISKKPHMVYLKSHNWILDFLGGHNGMEIAIVLLLIVPLTAATPLRPTPRSDTDTVLPGGTVQASEVERSEVTQQEQHAQTLKIIPFHSEDKHLGRDALKHSTAVKLRLRRAAQRGCQLGTCQLHNLANNLYNISKTNGKEESKKAHDPQGYGR